MTVTELSQEQLGVERKLARWYCNLNGWKLPVEMRGAFDFLPAKEREQLIKGLFNRLWEIMHDFDSHPKAAKLGSEYWSVKYSDLTPEDVENFEKKRRVSG